MHASLATALDLSGELCVRTLGVRGEVTCREVVRACRIGFVFWRAAASLESPPERFARIATRGALAQVRVEPVTGGSEVAAHVERDTTELERRVRRGVALREAATHSLERLRRP